MEEKGRARRWAFTNFNLKETYDHDILKDSYIIIGLEICPTTKKKHHQGYVEFAEGITFSTLKQRLPKAKIKEAYKGKEANIKYCSKDGNIILERGTRKEQGKRNDLKEIMEEIIENPRADLMDIIKKKPDTWARNYRAIDILRNLCEEKRNWVTECIYIWGEAGCGKSRYCIEKGATKVYIDRNGYFSGYNGEDVVLFDDIDEHTFENHRQVFLEMTDRYPYIINVKGGNRNWKPKIIYFTSNYPPEETLQYIKPEGAWKRRLCKIVELKTS